MALADIGISHTRATSNHTETNMRLIKQFLPVKFEVEPQGGAGGQRVAVGHLAD